MRFRHRADWRTRVLGVWPHARASSPRSTCGRRSPGGFCRSRCTRRIRRRSSRTTTITVRPSWADANERVLRDVDLDLLRLPDLRLDPDAQREPPPLRRTRRRRDGPRRPVAAGRRVDRRSPTSSGRRRRRGRSSRATGRGSSSARDAAWLDVWLQYVVVFGGHAADVRARDRASRRIDAARSSTSPRSASPRSWRSGASSSPTGSSTSGAIRIASGTTRATSSRRG